MFYYIFDTSVLLLYLLRLEQAKDEVQRKFIKNTFEYCEAIENLWMLQKAILYVPNIILAETKKYLAEKYITGESDLGVYRKKVNELIKLIEFKYSEGKSNYNIFFNVELNRHHVITFSKVCEIERLTPPTKSKIKNDKGELVEKESRLSFVDMMLLSISAELKFIHKEEVYLVSNDKRIRDIAHNNIDIFPHPLYIGEDEIPPRIKKIIDHE